MTNSCKIWLLFISFIILLNSCTSSKAIQKDIQTLRTDLFYELTSPEYQGEAIHDVYLNFIKYSNLNYYTTVKKKSTIFIPLILYNFSAQTFEITLGEASLTQNYREFLAEAFLAECNRSTCFNLYNNESGNAPDSAFILNVAILQNQTTTKVKLQESAIPWFGEDMEEELLSFTNNKTRPAITELKIQVQLSKNKKILHNKIYSIKREQATLYRNPEDNFQMNDTSLQTMAEGLSMATKQIVEEISQELHLLLSAD
ncbi:MAG: hypothetical protein LUH22_19160 [Bacteroides sp.]|nr:hypothetical protein [Bacteroides sp.]